MCLRARPQPHLHGIGSAHSVGQLGCQRGGDGVEVELPRAVVHRHLPPLALLVHVAKALRVGRARRRRGVSAVLSSTAAPLLCGQPRRAAGQGMRTSRHSRAAREALNFASAGRDQHEICLSRRCKKRRWVPQQAGRPTWCAMSWMLKPRYMMTPCGTGGTGPHP